MPRPSISAGWQSPAWSDDRRADTISGGGAPVRTVRATAARRARGRLGLIVAPLRDQASRLTHARPPSASSDLGEPRIGTQAAFANDEGLDVSLAVKTWPSRASRSPTAPRGGTTGPRAGTPERGHPLRPPTTREFDRRIDDRQALGRPVGQVMTVPLTSVASRPAVSRWWVSPPRIPRLPLAVAAPQGHGRPVTPS